MGGGSWSDSDYKKSVRGDAAFAYSRTTASKPVSERKSSKFLDPKGLKTRESRDSAEHPESNAVMVGLDVTGSMTNVVVGVQKALGNLMSMLLEGKYVPDPQMLFYAVGDATCDRVPFQVSQFESDNRISEQLTQVYLEGGGGGQNTESYELGFYVAARHTSIDCLEKRGRKGYLFTIGDEMPYGAVSAQEVNEIFGARLQDDIDLEAVVQEAREKYHLFHIIPRGSSNFSDRTIRKTWQELIGKPYVFFLDMPEATAELIAVAIGLNEGTVGFKQAIAAVAAKSGEEIAGAVQKALESFAQYAASKPVDTPSKTVRPPKKEKGGEDWKV